jgi:hypothetical protein
VKEEVIIESYIRMYLVRSNPLDASSKEAPVPPDLPVPNCDCGRPTWVCQSKHTNTTARCFYLCGGFNVRSL